MTEKNTIIGICTWTLGIKDLNTMMKKISDLGLNGVQYCEHPNDHSPAKVIKSADKYGLNIILYDPFDCGPGIRNGDATKENAIRFYRTVIDFAAELKVGATLQGLSSWTHNCETRAEGREQLVTCVSELAAYAKDKNVDLYYEPINLYETPFIRTADDFEKLIKDADCPDINILLDSFHMNIGEKCPLTTLGKYASKSTVFHISDSNRQGMGLGHIDFEQYYGILKKEGFNGSIVFEFVLETNAVNIAPQNATETHALDQQIQHSLSLWRTFEDNKGTII
ncbi:MAG: sugar phosphate isomerase/epimerase family protein [Alcanivorax sp.]